MRSLALLLVSALLALLSDGAGTPAAQAGLLSVSVPRPLSGQAGHAGLAASNAVARSVPSPQSASGDWAQVQAGPQHAGYAPEALGSSFKVAWTRPLQPETIHPQVQAIVSSGKVYVGTEMGRVYALDAHSGMEAWRFPAQGTIGPVLASVAAAGGRVFVPSMDGAMYGLEASSGAQTWKAQLSARLGFSTAPLLDDNANPSRVFIGGRDGVLYALDAATGAVVWRYAVGAPILQTAAYGGGRVVVGAMDMHVVAVNGTDGSLAWRSAQLSGAAFKDYWPVITQDRVVIRPTANTMGGGGIPVPNYGASTQDAALAAYDADPGRHNLSLHVLDLGTGQALPGVVHWSDVITMHGATAPPCVDRDGYLVIPAKKPNIYPDAWQGGWARLDLSSRKIVEGLIDTGDLKAGFGNVDENMAVTCTANGVLAIHTQELNAQYTGFFDLAERKWTPILPGHKSRQRSTNTQGGGANPASVVGGWVYHLSWHELIARTSS